MENELIKNLYLNQIPEDKKKYKLNKNVKIKRDLIKTSDPIQLPMIPVNKGGSIIIQSWNTCNNVPKEIENTNLPIIVDINKIQKYSSQGNKQIGSNSQVNLLTQGHEGNVKTEHDELIEKINKGFADKKVDEFRQQSLSLKKQITSNLLSEKMPLNSIPELERKLIEKQAIQRSIINNSGNMLVSQRNNTSVDGSALNTALQLYDISNQENNNLVAKVADRNVPPKKTINGVKNLIDFSVFTEHEQLTDNEFLYCKRIGSHIDYVMCSYKDLALNRTSKLNEVKTNKKGNSNQFSYQAVLNLSKIPGQVNALANVKSNQNNVEYITISRNTVMHNSKGTITIYGVHEWIDYFIKYKKLLNIALFKYFKSSKIFELWKKLLKSTKKRFYSEKLCLRFHRIDDFLLNGVFKIRKILSRMEHYDILKWTINKSVNIFEFQEFNKRHILEVEKEFMKIRNQVKKEIARACYLSYKKYKDEKKITIEDDIEDEGNISEDEDVSESNATKEKLNKTKKDKEKEKEQKNFVQNFLKDAMPYAQIATRRTHYKKLLRYIRSIDFIFNEAKYNMILNSLTNFQEFLSKLFTNNTGFIGFGLFIANLHPYGDKIIFNPLVDQCKKALIDDFIKEKILTVIYKQNFIDPTEFKNYNSCFEEVFEVTVDQNSSLNSRIHDDKVFKDLFSKIHEVIESTFDGLDKYSESLVPILQNYNKFTKIDFERLETTAAPQDLKDMLDDFIEEGQKISQIKEKVVIGILEYNLKNLKEMVDHAPREWLISIRNLIPKILSTKLMEMIRIITDKIKQLNIEPIDVKSFINLKTNMEDISSIKTHLEDKSNEIDDIYGIIESDKEIKLPEYELKLYREKKKLMVDFEKKLDSTIYFVDNNLMKFKNDLKDMTTKFDKTVKKSIEALNREEITRFNEASQETTTEKAQIALNALGELENDILNYQKEKTNFLVMEEKLDFMDDEVSKFKELSEIEYDFDLKKKLWTYISDLQLGIQELKQEQILALDVDDLEKKVIEYEKTGKEGVIDLDVVEVPNALLKSIQDLKDSLPILKCLQSKEIVKQNSPYYREINDLLGLDYNSPGNENFILKHLIAIPNFSKYIDDIFAIKNRAEKETLILTIYDSINASYKSIYLLFTKHNYSSGGKTESSKGPDRLVLSKFEIERLYSIMEEKIISLKKLKFNEYSSVKINDINNLLKNFFKFLNLLDDYVSLQHYILLSDEIIFFTDFQTKMPNEFKKFNNEHTMKNLQKLMKDQGNNAQKIV